LRYFLMREVVYWLDGDFSEERLTERYNADLANDLGNLISRVLAMADRYFHGEITVAPEFNLSPPLGHQALGYAVDLTVDLEGKIEALDFRAALDLIWRMLDAANKYIVETAPFTLAKDPAQRPAVARILANLLEILRVAANALEPFMPVMARRILDLLNVDEQSAGLPFGEGLKPGHKVKPPIALFPRIEKTQA
ncbi:MAG: class I tRNA ligase family protein, partial [Candidatus Binataceae bacterium]